MILLNILEHVTIGDGAAILAFIVSVCSGIAYLKKHLKDWVSSAVQEDMESLRKEILDLRQSVKDVDQENCKNFLVQFLAEVERGEPIDEIQKERFYEEYKHYTGGGGNGYIKRKVDSLEAKGYL